MAHRLPVIIYAILIFIQSSLPASEVVPDALNNDKVLHLLGYALMGALCMRAWLTGPFKHTGMVIMLSIVTTLLYGASDEFHQSFVPYRHADLLDVMADGVGGLIGTMLYAMGVSLIERRQSREKKSPETPEKA